MREYGTEFERRVRSLALPCDLTTRPRTMTIHPRALLNPHLANIAEYHPIQPLEVLSKRLGIAIENLVKLDANENPYGPIPAVREALANYEFLHIYPDPQQVALRDALARAMHVHADKVMASHGADELLDLLCRVFLQPGDAVINTPPTFGMYGFDAKLQGAEVIDVTRDAQYAIDAVAIRDVVTERTNKSGAVKLVFLTSPNNPSGNWLDDETLLQVLALPVMVVLDEAYVEFARHDSRVDWCNQYSNLVVLRTFSKAAGIAGLRLGYGVFPEWLMPTLWKFKQPYNVNIAASIAGLASLAHPEQVQSVVDKLRNERDRLYRLLTNVNYLQPVARSEANFILCKVLGRDAHELKLALEKNGVLVRHYASAGLSNCIRISIGRPQQTDKLITVLQQLNSEA